MGCEENHGKGWVGMATQAVPRDRTTGASAARARRRAERERERAQQVEPPVRRSVRPVQQHADGTALTAREIRQRERMIQDQIATGVDTSKMSPRELRQWRRERQTGVASVPVEVETRPRTKTKPRQVTGSRVSTKAHSRNQKREKWRKEAPGQFIIAMFLVVIVSFFAFNLLRGDDPTITNGTATKENMQDAMEYKKSTGTSTNTGILRGIGK